MSSETPSLEQKIRNVLDAVQDPETGRKLKKQIHGIEVEGAEARVFLGITSFAWPIKDEFHARVESMLKEQLGSDLSKLELVIEKHERPATPVGQVALKAKSIIAIAAGKGGVGKSTVATNLAIALNRVGCKTGLLDADVYGPSIPHLMGVRGQVYKEGNKIQPMVASGIPVMSIGFMVPPDQAVIWRGPMLHSAVTTFVRDTEWGDLDYLIIDMPPGTGDVALSLSQMLPLTGAVIVCTPQEVALIDAIKAVGMFRKVKIPVLGLVENMSSFLCPDNGKEYDIFGKGGAKQYASEAEIDFLGEIPINIEMRKRGDSGEMARNMDDPQLVPYLETVATNLCRTLVERAAANPVQTQLPVL